MSLLFCSYFEINLIRKSQFVMFHLYHMYYFFFYMQFIGIWGGEGGEKSNAQMNYLSFYQKNFIFIFVNYF